jgi:ABC-type glycerol-3-phosphate transport system substrate-binding protein
MRRGCWVLLVALWLGLGMAQTAQPIKLRFVSLAWQTEAVKAVKDVVAEWNSRNPRIQVEYQQVDWGSIQDYLSTSFQAKNVPDIFHYESNPVMDFGNRGFLLDLAPMIPAEMKQDISPGAWKTVTDPKGAVYGIPFLVEPLIVLYNKKLFTQAGIPLPKEGDVWTWDDLRRVAKTLTNGQQFGCAIPLRNAGNRILNLSVGFGGDYFTKTGDKFAVKIGEEEKQLLRTILAMLYEDKSCTPETLNLGSAEVIPGFLVGKYAMLPGVGAFVRQQIIEKAPKDFAWGVLPPLKAKTQDQGSVSQTISIPKDSKYPKEAMQFISFFLNRVNMAKLAAGDWLIPTRRTSALLPPFATNIDGWRTSVEAAKYLTFPLWQQVNGVAEFRTKVLNPKLQLLFANRLTLDDFAKQVETEGNEILKKYYP